jgi:kynurenine formamidase
MDQSQVEAGLSAARRIIEERQVPGAAEIEAIRHSANWNRWEGSDLSGAPNLISPEKRRTALSLVVDGECISLSRPLPVSSNDGEPFLASRSIMRRDYDDGSGSLHEEHTLRFHGISTTHIDALSHYWDRGLMWEGRSVAADFGEGGAEFGAITDWRDGVITRGILFDIAARRPDGYVNSDTPIHAWELNDVAEELGIRPEPGDAIVVYSGREEWERLHGGYQAPVGQQNLARPGLHPTCLAYLRVTDASVLVWDMMDLRPNGYRPTLTVHCAIPWFGVVLIDNADLHRLVHECRRRERYEFALVLAPLPIPGGTGSAINPLALF